MRRRNVLLFLALSLILAAALPAIAADGAADTATAEQSVEAAPAHDHDETCREGGGCCSACQFRQKYAAQKPAEADGGCPCKRAQQAREQAQAQPAAE